MDNQQGPGCAVPQRQCDVFEQVGGQGADRVDPCFGLWGVIMGKQWAQSSMRWVRMGGKEDKRSRDLKISVKMEEGEQRTDCQNGEVVCAIMAPQHPGWGRIRQVSGDHDTKRLGSR